MWDVFSDDKGLNNSVELALTNLDLNELVLEPVALMMVILLRGHPPESTSTNARIALDIGEEEEEDGGESSGSDANLDDYDMEDY
jgi:hypothetical protein